ncbi:DUF4282 domain-containing protein [Arenimonas caeni]|jgi:hypothetical protein|uniref:DUF4282 domain-containing protein n=1 Tax=Arenimonas caeni TaxID=2058085 RepID=A0A2P6M9S7_9GAMM|nr:DUF4282 domain-containing protein [Arenimonas caeni]MDY0022690.1 DUF4282 domain-containing protein [Arenimonas caeni]PRH82728.1 hypothetical protein C6N40_05830 [Arenimonas caeni]
MREFFFFDSMITPKVITFVYWLLLAAVALGGLMGVFSAFGTMKYSVWAGLGSLVLVPVGVILGVIGARIYCELMIVLFRVYETLVQIRDK